MVAVLIFIRNCCENKCARLAENYSNCLTEAEALKECNDGPTLDPNKSNSVATSRRADLANCNYFGGCFEYTAPPVGGSQINPEERNYDPNTPNNYYEHHQQDPGYNN